MFNSEGRIIAIIVDELKEAGTYEVEFDSCGLAVGKYYYAIEVGDYINKKKMLLIK